MEDLTSRSNPNSPESDLFSRFESTIQDPRTNKIIKKAIAMERTVNDLLAEDEIDIEEFKRRASQYQHYLERNWPLVGQTVSISGWIIDIPNSSDEKLELLEITDAVVVSEGLRIATTAREGSDYETNKITTFMRFASFEGNRKTEILALLGDLHIQPQVQSAEHADAILKECYPDLHKQIESRIELLYGQDRADEAVVDIFKDFMFEVDDDPALDAELVRSVERQINHFVEFETEVPSYVTAVGPYYEEKEYIPMQGVPGARRVNTSVPHDALVTPYKVAFRQSLEEDGLKMHVPVLECTSYGRERGSFPQVRQYPLRTIDRIVSLRDVPFGTYKPAESGL